MEKTIHRSESKANRVDPLVLYLGLTLLFSTIFWVLIAAAGQLTPPLTLGLMWSPGIAAILTRRLRAPETESLGWRLGPPFYLLLGYFLPPFIFLIAYGIAWLSRWVPILPEEAAAVLTARFWATWGVLTIGAILSAAGEEIGWRGLLVPLLNRRYGFGTAVIVSGLIWASWHYPLMLTIGYSADGIPIWYALIGFTLCVVGFSVFLGWLRLRSNSLWPAALAHATFNLALDIADGMTTTNPMRGYLLGESGILVAGAMIVVGLVFWLRQARLTMSTPTGYVPAGNMQKAP